ncbi:MAG: hypothetical protein MK188_03370 [Gammaproteobacteria bacterium]|nr:hypothetical protein [Gammaproteobacteria bacterium]
MKSIIRKLFAPLLANLESGDGEFLYKRSHRIILLIIGALFFSLATGVGAVGIYFEQFGALIPCVIFAAVGLVSLVVGSVGSDRAVAKLWSSR